MKVSEKDIIKELENQEIMLNAFANIHNKMQEIHNGKTFANLKKLSSKKYVNNGFYKMHSKFINNEFLISLKLENATLAQKLNSFVYVFMNKTNKQALIASETDFEPSDISDLTTTETFKSEIKSYSKTDFVKLRKIIDSYI